MMTAPASNALPRAPLDAEPRALTGAVRRRDRAVCARLGPFLIEVSGDHPDAIDDFSRLYADRLVQPPSTAGIIRLKISEERRTRWFRRRFAIHSHDEIVFENLRSAEVFPYLEWAANYRIIASCRRFLLLHAATLSWNGRGIMLAGRSGAGKSTLAAALVARGARYLCDEFALIDPETLQLQPFPKALCVKAGSFGIIQRLGLPLWRRRCHVKAFKGRVAYVAPGDLHPETSPVPLDLVVFPSFTGRAVPRSYPCPVGQAAFSLAAGVLNCQQNMERAVDIAGRVAGRAACFTVEAGDIEATAAVIAQLAESRARQPQAPNSDTARTCVVGQSR